jgi:hypothetical protein
LLSGPVHIHQSPRHAICNGRRHAPRMSERASLFGWSLGHRRSRSS